jgi:hypothetical protein
VNVNVVAVDVNDRGIEMVPGNVRVGRSQNLLRKASSWVFSPSR